MSVNNINVLYDKYCQEDYLCNKTRPKGMLRCGYCDEYYEPMCGDERGTTEIGYTVCKNCGEISFPYEEE
jgi:hypothetical protein